MLHADLYVEQGFYLFPVQKNKIPYAKFPWRELSTRDPLQWKMWSEEFEGCSWAIDCGKSGLVVVDIDPRNGGSCEKFDPFKTWKVKTPSGGFHFYFKGKAPCSKPWPGVDIKADGGYVLSPPSAKYELLFSEQILDLPDDLIPTAPVKEKFSVPEKIKDGTRDETLFKAACSLIGQNQPREVIEETLLATNQRLCEPPLDKGQVNKIIESAEKKRKPIEDEEPQEKRKREKKKYDEVKEYFDLVYPVRRFCPIKEDLFVRMDYDEWEKATAQTSILKSKSHEHLVHTGSVPDHIVHWASKSQSHLHENKMLIDIPEWDGKGRLVKFFAALNIQNMSHEHGYQLFKHYMANIWRRIEDPKTRNWALVIVGDQNVGKDWWVRELLGAWDKRYYFVSLKIFSDEIRTFSHIDGKIVLNISEFDNTKKWDPAFLKDLVTMEDIDYIPKYGKASRLTPTRHSIIATANKMDFLRDYTGSSRFLIFKMHDHQTIDYANYPRNESIQVIAEARQLCRDGYVASPEAIRALEAYQDSVTPENIPEMIKTEFNAILANRDNAAGLSGEPIFHPIAEFDSDFEMLCKRFGVSKDKIFKILKEDFGDGNTKRKGYRRRLQ